MVLATLENTRNILDVVSPESLEPVVHSFLQALAGNIATSNKVVSSSALTPASWQKVALLHRGASRGP